jgi:hypothetical protein
MFTLKFWRAAAERSLKTGAQYVLTVLGVAWTSAAVDTPTGEVLNALTWNWVTLGGAAVAGAVISLVFSLATAAATDGNPSLNDAEILAPTLAERLGTTPPPEPRPGDEPKFGRGL